MGLIHALIFFDRNKNMRILKLMHKPTRVFVSKEAINNCRKMYGDDLASLMLESVRNFDKTRNVSQIKTSFLKKVINKLRPEKELTINVISNKDKDFFVKSNLKVGNYNFVSKKVPFNISETLNTLKNYKFSIEQTKDDIIKQLAEFNKLKREMNRKFFRI